MASKHMRHSSNHFTTSLILHVILITLSHCQFARAATLRVKADLERLPYPPSISSGPFLEDELIPDDTEEPETQPRYPSFFPNPWFLRNAQFHTLLDNLDREEDNSKYDSDYNTIGSTGLNQRIGLLRPNQDSVLLGLSSNPARKGLSYEASVSGRVTDGENDGETKISDLLQSSRRNLEKLISMKKGDVSNAMRFSRIMPKQGTAVKRSDNFDPPMRHRYGADLFRIARRRYQPSRSSVAALAAVARRNSADAHPVYLGLGQDAAEAALDTLAQIIAEDSRRGVREQGKTKQTINFIG